MALTRNFKDTVTQRVQSDPAFAQALLDEAATLFLNGEPETARLILRDLVNATLGFEQLAALTAKPSKSLHRMLWQFLVAHATCRASTHRQRPGRRPTPLTTLQFPGFGLSPRPD
jgi:hypothetical protein